MMNEKMIDFGENIWVDFTYNLYRYGTQIGRFHPSAKEKSILSGEKISAWCMELDPTESHPFGAVYVYHVKESHTEAETLENVCRFVTIGVSNVRRDEDDLKPVDREKVIEILKFVQAAEKEASQMDECDLVTMGHPLDVDKLIDMLMRAL